MLSKKKKILLSVLAIVSAFFVLFLFVLKPFNRDDRVTAGAEEVTLQSHVYDDISDMRFWRVKEEPFFVSPDVAILLDVEPTDLPSFGIVCSLYIAVSSSEAYICVNCSIVENGSASASTLLLECRVNRQYGTADYTVGNRYSMYSYCTKSLLEGSIADFMQFFEYVGSPEECYSMGYSAGQTTGYNDGYTTGSSDGYNSGYNAGSSDGYNSGYNEGFREGTTNANYTNGFNVGYNSGYNEGYRDGEDVGNENGYDVGYNQGLVDSNGFLFNSGYNAGYDEGYTVGKSDGMNVTLTETFTNPVTYFLTPVQDFLDTPFFGVISLGSILNVILTITVACICIRLLRG